MEASLILPLVANVILALLESVAQTLVRITVNASEMGHCWLFRGNQYRLQVVSNACAIFQVVSKVRIATFLVALVLLPMFIWSMACLPSWLLGCHWTAVVMELAMVQTWPALVMLDGKDWAAKSLIAPWIAMVAETVVYYPQVISCSSTTLIQMMTHISRFPIARIALLIGWDQHVITHVWTVYNFLWIAVFASVTIATMATHAVLCAVM
jgi:hypothetical protein